MKKILMLFMLGMIILSVSCVSALELNPFANKKIYEPVIKEDMSSFIKEDFNSKYGVIQFSKTLFWIETDKIAEYSLIENTEECLINCEARGKAVLYQDEKLFDDLRFLNKLGNEKELSTARYYYKTFENYEIDVPDTYKEVCKDSNVTKGELITKSCFEVVDTYKKQTETREVWVEYKGEVLKAGDYEWKIVANKKPKESLDFIPMAQNKEISEWAWWNSSWGFKQAINFSIATNPTNADFQAVITIPYDSDMQNDFDDLRFTNLAENTELPYYLESKSDGVSAKIWVRLPASVNNTNQTLAYMYYGNGAVSSNSNQWAVWYFYDDFSASNTTKWTAIEGSLSVSGGKVAMDNDWIFSNIKFGRGTYYEVKMGGGGGIADGQGYVYPRNVQIVAGEDDGIFAGTNCASATFGTFNEGSATGGCGGGVATYTTSSLIGVAHANTSWAGLYINDAFILSRTATIPDEDMNLTLRDWDAGNFDVDWVRVRGWNSSVVFYSFGTETTAEGVSVSLNSPVDFYNSSSQTINFNATLTPTSANLTNVTFRVGAIEETNSLSESSPIVYNWTKILSDGAYIWNVTSCAIGQSSTILCTTSSNRNLTIDSTAPNLTLTAPLTNFTTLSLPINVTLNFTATDSHLSSCWYSSTLNSSNTTFTCNAGTNLSVSSGGAQTIYYFANDTFGNVASGTAPFYVYYVQANGNATNPITEGGYSHHYLYVNMTNITHFGVTANLFWNGTSYGAGTPTNVSNDSIRFDKSFVVPSITGTSADWVWYYNISGNPNVTNNNISGSQSYIKINITECGAGTYQILNYTLFDQDTKLLGSTDNASIEVDLNLTSYANTSQSWKFNATKTSSTSFLICLPSGALNSSSYELDAIAKYSYQDHVVQYHYIVNFNLSNSTIPQTLKLYDLATAKSTSFLINYQDENYLYIEDAIIDVWRRYIGDGVFFSVEHGKTDAQGQTRLHLVTEDIIYKFLVWQDGELVYTSPEYLALCQATPCQINLRKTIDETSEISERDNLVYSYNFNKTTRTASFVFATKDNTETEINMTILSSNQYENETACTTTLTTSGGQIDCAIPLAYTNTTYQTLIYKDGEYFGTAFDSLAPGSNEIFGKTGIILTAIAYLMLALMGISSGIATIVFGIVGLVFMGIIQIFESGNIFGMASAIIWLIVAGVIIIIKITKRRIS